MHGRLTTRGERTRVLLLLSSLHGGGAEKVAVQLLERLDAGRFDVRMGLLRAAGPWLADADRERIVVAPNSDRFIFEGTNKSFYRPGRLTAAVTAAPRAFRTMIEDFAPHVAMSFLKGTNIAAWASLWGMKRTRPRFIVREGNNTRAVIEEELSGRLARAAVHRLTASAYRNADRVLANSSAMAEGITADLRLDPARVVVINNPVDLVRVRKLASASVEELPERPFILTVGRLEVQKAQDILIRAYAASAARHAHDLVILGRGTREQELRALAATLGVADRVRFPGFFENPYAWMARAALFVLPSRWEGFPTVAVEALALGRPVLLTDCPFGPRDVLEDRRSGWMVPVGDASALTAAIDRLIDDPDLRAGLGAEGRARSERFSLSAILPRYEALFAEQAGLA